MKFISIHRKKFSTSPSGASKENVATTSPFGGLRGKVATTSPLRQLKENIATTSHSGASKENVAITSPFGGMRGNKPTINTMNPYNLNNNSEIEQEYLKRKDRSLHDLYTSWLQLKNHEIHFSEVCFQNLKAYKAIEGEVKIPDAFMFDMQALFYEEENPALGPYKAYRSVYEVSNQIANSAKKAVADKNMSNEIREKLKSYVAYHQTNKQKFFLMKRHVEEQAFQAESLRKLLKNKLKTKFTRADQFQNNLLFSLKRLSFCQAAHLKYSVVEAETEIEESEGMKHNHATEVYKDFIESEEYFIESDKQIILNPSILEPFQEEKRVYLQALKAWFLDVLEVHRVYLGLEELPVAYRKAYIFIEDLDQAIININIHGLNDSKVGIEKHTINQEELNKDDEDYPKYIFHNAKAYYLFCTMIAHATIINQIAFVFRHMSEIENPPLITIKDAAFRKWYNEQTQFPIKLDNTTATYLNSKNADRIMAYNSLKNQIF